jgi:hypothetical protein
VVEIGSPRPFVSKRALALLGGAAAFIAGLGVGYQLNDGGHDVPEPQSEPAQPYGYAADVFATPSVWVRPIGQISGLVEVECGVYDYNAFPTDGQKPAFQPYWYRVYNYNVGETTGFVRAEHVSLEAVAPACPAPIIDWVQLQHDFPGIGGSHTVVPGRIVSWNTDEPRQAS